MKTKRIAAIICLVLVAAMLLSLGLSALGGAFAATQAEIDALKEQQEELNGKMDELGAQIGNLEDQMDAAMERKALLDEQNELARQEIELINEQIAMYENLVETKAQELEEAIEQEEAQKQALRRRMREMEEAGNLTYIAIIFNASSFTDLLSRLDFVNSIMENDKQMEDAYIAAREHVAEVKAEYEATLAEHEATKIQLEDKKAELERQIAAAEQLMRELEEDIERYKAEYAEFEAFANSLEDDINRKVAELEAQQKKEEMGNYVTGTGTYKWPLPGYSAGDTFGWRMHPILNVNKWHAGEDIGAPSGTPILAADSGTVITANSGNYGGGYGNYVVISHGNGMTTLYAHQSAIAVSLGQSVTQGQVIGYVGSTGLSTGPHLHFEVRLNGVATDPLSYTYF
ncbi:MAG: peptidoglycan DD-metalloendopeptidase family protein [Oscillospiraceae bacterium]|nr:peptidoglycan DD-metalloendopeptidase family protein [Oscillospiraceae bacterium]